MPRATTSASAGKTTTRGAASPATTKAAKGARGRTGDRSKATKAGKPKPTKATKATKPAKAGKEARASKEAKGGKEAKSAGGADRFVEAQRQELLAERDAYTRSATSLQAEAEQLAQEREPGDVQFDEESGEGDSMNVERERDLALSAQALASIEEIDLALAKIEQGRYGLCDRCGEAIPRERLKALPHAALCVKCKSGGLSRR